MKKTATIPHGDLTSEQEALLLARSHEEDRQRDINKALNSYIEHHGLTANEKLMRSRNGKVFMTYMLGKLVLDGWLHGDVYERRCGRDRYPEPDVPRHVLSQRLRYGAGPNGEIEGPPPTLAEREDIIARLHGKQPPHGIPAKERERLQTVSKRITEFIRQHPLTPEQLKLREADMETSNQIILGEMVLYGWLHPMSTEYIDLLYKGGHPWWLHPQDWPKPFGEMFPGEDVTKPASIEPIE